MRRYVRTFYTQVGKPLKVTEITYEFKEDEWDNAMEAIWAEFGRQAPINIVHGGARFVFLEEHVVDYTPTDYFDTETSRLKDKKRTKSKN